MSKIREFIPSARLQSEQERDALVANIHEAEKFADWYFKFTEDSIKMAHALHKKLTTDRASILKPVGEYIQSMKSFVIEFQEREQARQIEQQNKLNDEIAKDTPEGIAPLAVTIPKLTAPDGLQMRSTWRAKVVDFKALVKAVAAGKVPMAAIRPACADDEDFDKGNYLDAQAKSLKGEMNIPGVVAKEIKNLASIGGE